MTKKRKRQFKKDAVDCFRLAKTRISHKTYCLVRTESILKIWRPKLDEKDRRKRGQTKPVIVWDELRLHLKENSLSPMMVAFLIGMCNEHELEAYLKKSTERVQDERFDSERKKLVILFQLTFHSRSGGP